MCWSRQVEVHVNTEWADGVGGKCAETSSHSQFGLLSWNTQQAVFWVNPHLTSWTRTSSLLTCPDGSSTTRGRQIPTGGNVRLNKELLKSTYEVVFSEEDGFDQKCPSEGDFLLWCSESMSEPELCYCTGGNKLDQNFCFYFYRMFGLLTRLHLIETIQQFHSYKCWNSLSNSWRETQKSSFLINKTFKSSEEDRITHQLALLSLSILRRYSSSLILHVSSVLMFSGRSRVSCFILRHISQTLLWHILRSNVTHLTWNTEEFQLD